MVAFHVRRGVIVPLSAAEFYAGLEQRFPVRDGMYFLPDQAAEYDKKRMTVKEVLQLSLFVTDEASAIQWLKAQLTRKPQTFQELYPQFIKEIGGWQKHEKPLELSVLLEQNFLRTTARARYPGRFTATCPPTSRNCATCPRTPRSFGARERTAGTYLTRIKPATWKSCQFSN